MPNDQLYEVALSPFPRYSRRLASKIMVAFDHACDQYQFEVAEQLLAVMETAMLHRRVPADGTQRRNVEMLVAAHEKLWHLRHPEPPQE